MRRSHPGARPCGCLQQVALSSSIGGVRPLEGQIEAQLAIHSRRRSGGESLRPAMIAAPTMGEPEPARVRHLVAHDVDAIADTAASGCPPRALQASPIAPARSRSLPRSSTIRRSAARRPSTTRPSPLRPLPIRSAPARAGRLLPIHGHRSRRQHPLDAHPLGGASLEQSPAIPRARQAACAAPAPNLLHLLAMLAMLATVVGASPVPACHLRILRALDRRSGGRSDRRCRRRSPIRGDRREDDRPVRRRGPPDAPGRTDPTRPGRTRRSRRSHVLGGVRPMSRRMGTACDGSGHERRRKNESRERCRAGMRRRSPSGGRAADERKGGAAGRSPSAPERAQSSRSFRFRILPVGPLGSSSTISIRRGYL